MKSIAVFLAQGFEEVEALTVVDLCRRAGIQTEMVSITQDTFVTGAHGIKVQTDKLLKELDFDSLSMIVLPGGMPGTLNLEACEFLMEQLDDFYEKGKCIGAICAAPSIFGHRGYLKGRNACCFPSFEDQLEGAKISYNPVEVSDHVITSRSIGTAMDFGLAIVEKLLGREKAESLIVK